MLQILISDRRNGLQRLESKTVNRSTLLHAAVANRRFDIIRIIIEIYTAFKPADIQQYILQADGHSSALDRAASVPIPEALDLLLRPFGHTYVSFILQKPDAVTPEKLKSSFDTLCCKEFTGTNRRMTALQLAVQQSNDRVLFPLLEKAKQMESQESYTNQQDDSGDTALLHAASQQHYGMIILLAKNGADFSITNDKGETPVLFLANAPFLTKFKIPEAACNTQTREERETPLHRAIPWNEVNRENALFLLRLGANPMIPRSDGKTALHLAAELGRDDLLPAFIEYYSNHRASLDLIDNRGRTALHLTLTDPKNVKIEIAKQLIKAGASLDTPDCEGNTPRTMIKKLKLTETFEIAAVSPRHPHEGGGPGKTGFPTPRG